MNYIRERVAKTSLFYTKKKTTTKRRTDKRIGKKPLSLQRYDGFFFKVEDNKSVSSESIWIAAHQCQRNVFFFQ